MSEPTATDLDQWASDMELEDLSTCAYFRGVGPCSIQPLCYSEPACHTERPLDGWPGERESTAKEGDQ